MNGPQVLADPDAVARAAAEHILKSAASAIGATGGFRIGLSGGRTPERLYRLLGTPGMATRVAWERVSFFFSDERDAPPNEPDSQYWVTRKLLMEPVGARPDHIHRMKADAHDLEAAAREYDARLDPPLDLLLLGVGRDGHIASIFPGSPLVRERRQRVAAVTDSPRPPRRRLTVTPRAIDEAREVMVLATGSDKAVVLVRVFAEEPDVAAIPAGLLREAKWLVDRAAAEILNRS